MISRWTSHKWRNNSGPGKLGGQFGQMTSSPNEESDGGLGAVPFVVEVDKYRSSKGECDWLRWTWTLKSRSFCSWDEAVTVEYVLKLWTEPKVFGDDSTIECDRGLSANSMSDGCSDIIGLSVASFWRSSVSNSSKPWMWACDWRLESNLVTHLSGSLISRIYSWDHRLTRHCSLRL